MRVGICDDVEAERKNNKRVCCQIMESLGEEPEFVEFSNGKEVLEYTEELDLLLLDLEMPELDGLTLKRKMEDGDSNVIIIYLTGHPEWVFKGYGKNAMAFIVKSDLEKELPDVLPRIINNIKRNVWIYNEISSRRVTYIQADDNYQIFHFRNGKHEMRSGRMDKLEELLENADFVRTHRKYLVNMFYVEEIKRGKMIVHGKEIPIATRARKTVKERYAEFHRRQAKLC